MVYPSDWIVLGITFGTLVLVLALCRFSIKATVAVTAPYAFCAFMVASAPFTPHVPLGIALFSVSGLIGGGWIYAKAESWASREPGESSEAVETVLHRRVSRWWLRTLAVLFVVPVIAAPFLSYNEVRYWRMIDVARLHPSMDTRRYAIEELGQSRRRDAYAFLLDVASGTGQRSRERSFSRVERCEAIRSLHRFKPESESDQIKSLDWRGRRARRACAVPSGILNEVVARVLTLVDARRAR